MQAASSVGLLCALFSLTLSGAVNQTFSDQSGFIHSPNYPSNYSANLNYYITITVEPGYYIYLTLLDFETEPCCDSLSIYDGTDTTKNALVKVAGVATGSNYSSSSNTVTMLFHTDISNEARGFAIGYQQVKDNTKVMLTNICPPVYTVGTFGFILSPNWPNIYPNNDSCKYLITSNSNRLMLQFVAFQTEDCCDSVTIYDGSDDKAAIISKISGLNMPDNSTFYSTGKTMFVVFSADFTYNFSGFSAYFVSIT